MLQARAKSQSDLILEAIKTGDTAKAAKNLQFSSSLDSSTTPTAKLRSTSQTGRIFPFFRPTTAAAGGELRTHRYSGTVAKLAPDSIERVLSNSVGMIRFGEASCTARLVRSDMIITADYCVATGQGQTPPVFIVGYLSADLPSLEIPVSPTPVKTDTNLGYAILRLQTTVPQKT
jgi:hypothetical protein